MANCLWSSDSRCVLVYYPWSEDHLPVYASPGYRQDTQIPRAQLNSAACQPWGSGCILVYLVRGPSIDVYDYKTSKYLTTILSSNNLNEVSYFLDYTFSNDESKILIATSEQPLYRHSKLGLYYIYDVSTKTLIQLSEEYVQEPSFSPGMCFFRIFSLSFITLYLRKEAPHN